MKENKDMPEEWHWLRRFFLITVFGFWAFLSSNFALMHHMAILVISTFSLCAFIYLLIRKRYSKSFRLVFSFFLLICVFPMTYYFIYLNDNNSFNYEESILKLNKKYNAEELAHFSDSSQIRNCLKLKDSILNSPPLRDELYGGFYFEIHNEGLITRQLECHILKENRKLVLNLQLADFRKPLKAYVYEYLSMMETVKGNIRNPKFVFLRDFWFESLSGFSFGDIKAVSPFARFVRLLQLIATFIFGAFLVSLTDIGKFFNINKLKRSKK